MKIVVVDHLPCENNELGMCSGMTQQGVSAFGRSLARYVSVNESEHAPFKAIFTSTLPRAIESAELYFGKSKLPISRDRRLCAVDYGEYHHLRMRDILDIQHRYIFQPFPGGESYADMASRYVSFFEERKAHYAESSVVLIGHYGTRELLRHICSQVPLDQVFGPRPDYDPNTRREAIERSFAAGKYAAFVYN